MDQQTVCPQCSEPVVPGASFCTKCGAALGTSAQPAPAQPTADSVKPQEGPQVIPSQPQTQPVQPGTGPAYNPPQPAQPYTTQQQGQPYQAQQPQGQPQQNQPYQNQQQSQPYQTQQPQGQPYTAQGPAYQPPYQSPSSYPSVPKSRMAAGLLGIFLGSLGIHNFYLGYTNKALVQLLVSVCTCGIGALPMWIWGLVEGIQILTGTIATDAKGIPLSE